MAMDDVKRIEAELTARGIPFKRYLAGRTSDPGRDDPGWVLEVGGKVVARGVALGKLGTEMARWRSSDGSR